MMVDMSLDSKMNAFIMLINHMYMVAVVSYFPKLCYYRYS